MTTTVAGLKSRLSVCFENTGGHTRARYTTQPPLDLRGPLVQSDGGQLYYLRNHTCGILSRDDLEVDITAMCGVDVRIASPSSTKVYTSDERSRSRLRIETQPGSHVVWGPQPLILHEGADFAQATTIALLGGTVVYSDVVVLGRLARGESQRFRRFESSVSVIGADGEPLYDERYVLEPETMPGLAASLGGMGAIASVFALGMPETPLDGFAFEGTNGSVFSGYGALPNHAGCIARALAPSLSEALAFVEAATRYVSKAMAPA